jgi:hypothetical protein
MKVKNNLNRFDMNKEINTPKNVPNAWAKKGKRK